MPAPIPLESSVTSKILAALRKRGAWATKVHVSHFQAAGTPDVLACYKGRFLGLEIKRDAKHKATALQEYTLEAIRTAGGTGLVVWSVAMVDQILDTIERWEGV